MQILWFGRPQGKQMPQSESCVPRRDLIRRHDRLTLPSARPAPYSSTLLAPRRDPIPSNTPIRSCRPLLVHAFADPAPHSPNSPNSPNSPKLVHAFVDPHSPLAKLAKLAELAQTRPYPQFRRHRFLLPL